MSDQPSNTVTACRTRVQVDLDLTVEDGSPVINAFGESEPLTGIRLTFANGQLKAVRLETADPGHCAFVDAPELERPQTWPAFLREALAAHDPGRHEREAAALRSTLAALREVLNNTALPDELRGQLVQLLDG
ncbi:hypothetical protein ACFXPX_38540 [Kitasatospora sp. NPDC059146]|uniref:hypothetical protein n=1 Tax=unclassified Kitasatospora TaxID=2633591 RepID=UPI0036752600